MYAQALGDRSAAAVHFRQVSTPAQSTSQSEGRAAARLARLAAASVAICELEDGAAAGLTTAEQLGRAADALATFGPTTSAALATLSPLDQAAMQLAVGKLAERRGEVSEARMQLTKALKLAHNVIGNTQLVTQARLARAARPCCDQGCRRPAAHLSAAVCLRERCRHPASASRCADAQPDGAHPRWKGRRHWRHGHAAERRHAV
jgi:hypothetical protein